MVGNPEVSQKRALEEINGDLPEEDFWTGVTSGLPVIRELCYLPINLRKADLRLGKLQSVSLFQEQPATWLLVLKSRPSTRS